MMNILKIFVAFVLVISMMVAVSSCGDDGGADRGFSDMDQNTPDDTDAFTDTDSLTDDNESGEDIRICANIGEGRVTYPNLPIETQGTMLYSFNTVSATSTVGRTHSFALYKNWGKSDFKSLGAVVVHCNFNDDNYGTSDTFQIYRNDLSETGEMVRTYCSVDPSPDPVLLDLTDDLCTNLYACNAMALTELPDGAFEPPEPLDLSARRILQYMEDNNWYSYYYICGDN
jgi:hypothetical protein